jgi:sulfur carrier protein
VRIELNGESLELDDGATLEVAVRESGVAGETRGVAVAVDGEVVPRTDWGSVALSPDARVEVLRAMQGG